MKLRPQDFWALTPAEWRALRGAGEAGVTRADFESLLALYPDETGATPRKGTP